MGTETLLPGAVIPEHRHLQQDEVLFVHKGQGRAMLDGHATTVVPGTVVFVPRQAWHSLRNTGTGALQVIWTAVPAGLEQFFRDYARLGPAADTAAFQTLAQRYGIELRPAGEQPKERAARHRRRRGGRGRGRGTGQPPSPSPSSLVSAAPAAPKPQPSPAEPQRSRGGRGRHRRHRGGAGGSPAPAPSAKTPPPAGRPPRGGLHHRRRHVKEVYMGGRWVQVEGEGPVIAPGKERPRKRGAGDSDTPAGPLSVPL